MFDASGDLFVFEASGDLFAFEASGDLCEFNTFFAPRLVRIPIPLPSFPPS